MVCCGRLGSQHVIFPFAFGILAASIKMAKIDGVSHGTCVRTPAATAQTDSNAIQLPYVHFKIQGVHLYSKPLLVMKAPHSIKYIQIHSREIGCKECL